MKAADLSERLDISPQNVFKIVHILSRSGLITAQRGRNGGVTLAHPATEIRIGDVVRAMEATEVEIDSDGPGIARPSDGERVSDVNRVLDAALEAFTTVLDKHSLADMVNTRRKPARGAAVRASRQGASALIKIASVSATKSRGDASRSRR